MHAGIGQRATGERRPLNRRRRPDWRVGGEYAPDARRRGYRAMRPRPAAPILDHDLSILLHI
ncbi:hypothetical protein C4900_11045 [Acidiferrobacter thiooxydans]|uniref:Uncharacterized protein n=1 Tax=Acidiferrobacter thiooxydans TaxID=163359 RepID=A0A368HD49_9GAMM|nr:hypothetical protein C4900_11045 [Acidiferrobacter thiooxydans]